MHSLIEFSHRLLVFIVSVLVVATAVVAWIDHRDIPSLVWPATAAFPLVIGQAILGGVVVHTDLNPWWVTAALRGGARVRGRRDLRGGERVLCGEAP